MATVIELTEDEWDLVKDLFDPQGRLGVPERYSRQEMVDALLFMARTGIQWRYLPERCPPWWAVWQEWRRWRANGVWARAMVLLAHAVRILKKRPSVEPSMVMVDAQAVRGGRFGPTFHNAGGRGGRTIGAKRSILIEILGLPLAVRVDPASPHDVKVGRELVADSLPGLPRPGDPRRSRLPRPGQARRSQEHQAQHQGSAGGQKGFTPIAPLSKVEHALPVVGDGDGCRAATKGQRRAHKPGSRSPQSPACSLASESSRPDRSPVTVLGALDKSARGRVRVRARLREARALAQALALLRGDRNKRPCVAPSRLRRLSVRAAASRAEAGLPYRALGGLRPPIGRHQSDDR